MMTRPWVWVVAIVFPSSAYTGKTTNSILATVYYCENYLLYFCPRANGAERRSGRQPGARVLIPPGYLHPGKGKHFPSLKFINNRGWSSSLISKIWVFAWSGISKISIFKSIYLENHV